MLFKEKLLDDYVAKQPIKPQWTLLNTKSMSFDLLCDLWSTSHRQLKNYLVNGPT